MSVRPSFPWWANHAALAAALRFSMWPVSLLGKPCAISIHFLQCGWREGCWRKMHHTLFQWQTPVPLIHLWLMALYECIYLLTYQPVHITVTVLSTASGRSLVAKCFINTNFKDVDKFGEFWLRSDPYRYRISRVLHLKVKGSGNCCSLCSLSLSLCCLYHSSRRFCCLQHNLTFYWLYVYTFSIHCTSSFVRCAAV